MRRLEIAGLILAASITAVMAAPVWNTKDSAVLSGLEGQNLLKQCSRWTPKGVTGFWTPGTDQIAALEEKLPAALSSNVYPVLKRHVELLRPPPPMPKFFRQYTGVAMGARQQIYVNAFPSDENGFSPDRRGKALVICDGGPSFWGALFDPQSGTFSDFAFNGIA